MKFKDECKDCEFLNSLSDVLNCSKDALYKYNFRTGKYDFVSNSIEDISGLTPEQITAKGVDSLRELMHPDDLEKFEQVYSKLLNSEIQENEITIEYRSKNVKTGQYLWRSDHINIIRNPEGKIEYIVGNARDITKNKQIEQNLTNLLENYKNLYDNAEVALFRTRFEDGKMLECNDKLVQILGYISKQECLEDFIAEEKQVNTKFRDQMKDLLSKNGYFNDLITKVYRKDGSVCTLRLSARLHPKMGYLEGAAVEITEIQKLTDMEKKILKMIIDGNSNRDIAEKLERSVRTIEDHRAHIMQKMGTKNLVQLTKKAIEAGIA